MVAGDRRIGGHVVTSRSSRERRRHRLTRLRRAMSPLVRLLASSIPAMASGYRHVHVVINSGFCSIRNFLVRICSSALERSTLAPSVAPCHCQPMRTITASFFFYRSVIRVYRSHHGPPHARRQPSSSDLSVAAAIRHVRVRTRRAAPPMPGRTACHALPPYRHLFILAPAAPFNEARWALGTRGLPVTSVERGLGARPVSLDACLPAPARPVNNPLPHLASQY